MYERTSSYRSASASSSSHCRTLPTSTWESQIQPCQRSVLTRYPVPDSATPGRLHVQSSSSNKSRTPHQPVPFPTLLPSRPLDHSGKKFVHRKGCTLASAYCYRTPSICSAAHSYASTKPCRGLVLVSASSVAS